MDPLSITVGAASLAKLAFNLAQTLYSGVQEAKGVDATLEVFAGEIKALSEALQLIDAAFQDPKLKDVDAQARMTNVHLSKVIDSLRRVITDCEDTLVKLDAIIQRSSKGFKKTVFRRTVTAIKLNFSSADIALIRQQVQSYISAMQMTLSMLNISLVLSQSQFALSFQSELLDKIASLEESRGALQTKIASSRQSNQNESSRFKLQNLDRYLEVSGSVLSGATSYHGSLNGSVIMNHGGREEGSVISLDPAQRVAIETYLEGQSTNTVCEDSFQVRLNHRRLGLAGKKMTQSEFSDAEELLNTFLLNAEGSEHHPSYQLLDAKMALALCYENQRKFDDAANLLKSVLDSGDLPSGQRLHTMHRLAESYLKNSNAKDALPLAIDACEGRHNLNRDERYFESCVLVANIHSALGNRAEAELYLEDLPSSHRQKLAPAAPNDPRPFLPAGFLPLGVNDGALSRSPEYLEPVSDRDVSGKLNRTIPTKSSVHALSISPDGRKLVFPTWNTLNFLDVASGKLQETPMSHEEGINSIDISYDGRRVASGSRDCTIKLWDAQNGALQKVLKGHTDYVRAVAFAPDGNTLVSGSDDKTIKVWSVETGRLRETLMGYDNYVMAVAFSPDGRTFVSGALDNSVKIWLNGPTCNLHKTLEGHSSAVDSVAFSPDGRKIASASWDSTVKIWDAATGKLLKILAHTGQVNPVVFTSDGKSVISCADGKVTLWNVDTGAKKVIKDTQYTKFAIPLAMAGNMLFFAYDMMLEVCAL